MRFPSFENCLPPTPTVPCEQVLSDAMFSAPSQLQDLRGGSMEQMIQTLALGTPPGGADGDIRKEKAETEEVPGAKGRGKSQEAC